MFLKQKQIRLFVIVCIVFCSLPAVQAEGWSYEPFAKATLRYDNNIRFVHVDEEASVAGLFEGGVNIINETATSFAHLIPRLRQSGYVSGSDLNSTDLFLDFKTEFKGPRTKLGFTGEIAKDSSVIYAVEEEGNAAGSNASIGLIRWKAIPTWEYRLNQRNSIEFGADFSKVSWDEDANEGLYDNDSIFAWGRFVRQMTEHLDGRIKPYFRSFKSSETRAESKTIGGEVGLYRVFSERFNGSIDAGLWTSDVEVLDDVRNDSGGFTRELVSDNVEGFSVRGRLNYFSELSNNILDISHFVVPSSTGQVREQSRAHFRGEYKITPKLSWGLTALYQESSPLGQVEREADRKLIRVKPFLAWQFQPNIKLLANVQFSDSEVGKERFIDENGNETFLNERDAGRTEFMLTLEYRKPKNSIF